MCMGGGAAPPPTPQAAAPAAAPPSNAIPVVKRKGTSEKDKSELAKKRLGKSKYRIRKDPGLSTPGSSGAGLSIPSTKKAL
jgi:hypothetical protein